MEQKLPLITKKLCNLVRAIFFTLKKDISKRKFLLHFNMMMKRGNIAGKSPSGEYEFSCKNTPNYALAFFSTRKKHQNKCNRLSNYDPPLFVDDCDEITIDPSVIKVLNTMTSATKLPPSSGFVKSPIVEQMMKVDSSVCHGFEDGQVDEAAEKFIRRFFNDLRQENI